MKIFTSILVFLAVALIVFNITLLDFRDPFKGDSVVAFIGIAAALCAVGGFRGRLDVGGSRSGLWCLRGT